MNRKYLIFLAAAICFAAILAIGSGATGTIQCYFNQSTTCPTDSTKFLGLENDSNGYQNAHVQNWSLNSYTWSLCCNTTNASITLNRSCSGATYLKLSDEDNAHVQGGNNSDYPVSACMNISFQNVTITYVQGTCGGGTNCLFSMANSEGENYTNAHLGNCSEYGLKVCASLQNYPPSAPNLVYPLNANTTVFERYVNLTWNASTDPEGNSITYTVNATCNSCSATCPFSQTVSALNYTHSVPLCADVNYNWTVTACDTYAACNTSTKSNFTILSVNDFVLLVNSTDFGGMGLGEAKQTNTTLTPFIGRNNGNIKLNATINASRLFVAVQNPSAFFLYNSSDNETGSLVAGCSQASFAQFSGSQLGLFCNLTYQDTSDEVRININITIPMNETQGQKRSVIEIVALPVAER